MREFKTTPAIVNTFFTIVAAGSQQSCGDRARRPSQSGGRARQPRGCVEAQREDEGGVKTRYLKSDFSKQSQSGFRHAVCDFFYSLLVPETESVVCSHVSWKDWCGGDVSRGRVRKLVLRAKPPARVEHPFASACLFPATISCCESVPYLGWIWYIANSSFSGFRGCPALHFSPRYQSSAWW